MKKGSPVIIILLAVIIVAIVSFLPLSKWTDGKVKDFSLFSDILKEVKIMEGDNSSSSKNEEIDPELRLTVSHVIRLRLCRLIR